MQVRFTIDGVDMPGYCLEASATYHLPRVGETVVLGKEYQSYQVEEVIHCYPTRDLYDAYVRVVMAHKSDCI